MRLILLGSLFHWKKQLPVGISQMSRSKSQQFSQLSIVLGLHVSHYPVYTEITKITSSIDAKIEPHEGRNMASVNLHAQVQTGCVTTKGTRLCLENASD